MNFLNKWLRPSPPQNAIAQESPNDFYNEASFVWLGKDPIDSSIFDSVHQSADKPDDDDHKPHQEHAPDGDLLSSAEKNMGYDPYDTGRFYKKRA